MGNRRAAAIANLCYLPAHAVEIPAGKLAGYDLCNVDDQKLGTVDGVLIDPAEGRVRYFVIRPEGWLGRRRYLLSADETAHLEPDEHKLRVEVDARHSRRHTFDESAVRCFSDDDLLTALFSRRN